MSNQFTQIEPGAVSSFLNALTDAPTATPAKMAQVFEAIRTNQTIKTATENYRKKSQPEEAEEFAARSFLCIAPCGNFSPTISVANLQAHSGLIAAHLRNLPVERLTTLKKELQQDQFICALFTDIAGTGLIAFFRIEIKEAVDHQDFERQISAYLQEYGVTTTNTVENGDAPELEPGSLQVDWRFSVPYDPVIYCRLSGDAMVLLPEYRTATINSQPVGEESTSPAPCFPKTDFDLLREELHRQQQRAQEATSESTTTEPREEDTAQHPPQYDSSDRPVVGEFPIDIFPEMLQEVVHETVAHMNFRRGWIGSSILYAACVAVGNLYGVLYKNYKQRPLLFLALVGLPGTNKSAPPQFALAPLAKLDTDYYQTYKSELVEYNRWLKLAKKERESEGLPPSMNPPIYRTLLVSDVTQEFLVQTHEQNPVGVGLFMDELAGWFKNFTRYNKGSEEQFWLSAWSLVPSGSGRKIGVSKLAQPLLPVAGTIQPGVLGELARDGRNQNGFVDRILFDYPDNQTRCYDTDEELSERVTNQYQAFMDKLLTLRQQAILDEAGNVETQWLQFSEKAFAAMRTWKNKNTDRINQTSSDAQKGIYAKLDIYCLRFALIIELMDWACGQSDLQKVQLNSVERAIRLTDYFRQNAEKVHYELNIQSMAERLPSDQQRLFNALPDEVTTEECVTTAQGLTPPLSESTAKRLLKNAKLFRRVGYGEYTKLC